MESSSHEGEALERVSIEVIDLCSYYILRTGGLLSMWSRVVEVLLKEKSGLFYGGIYALVREGM
ncbi:MAG: hypothetical protein RMI83_06155 [Desulfurococcaceae archaeon]|nr:hypothetical protein [Sulfolobales archaeon]MDW8170660.1 hypothetical protein [Desulfurococcaceae archaeon]